MTEEDILQRLKRLDSETDQAIIDDIYDLALKQLAGEDTQSAKLDVRASSLFGAVGFSMTIAFSFGGWSLLDNARKVPHGRGIAVAFVVALLMGLVTSGFALAGLKLSKGHVVPDEQDIFRTDMLWPRRKKADYRIYIATHLWGIWQQRYDRNEKRARRILFGQISFFVFLVAILGLSAFTTFSAIKRGPDEQASPLACSVNLTGLVATPPAPYSGLSVGVYDAGAPEAATPNPRPSGKGTHTAGDGSAPRRADAGSR